MFIFIITKWVHVHAHSSNITMACVCLHRALCSLFQPDTDSTRVSKCWQLISQVSVYINPSSSADHKSFSRTAGQSQAHYNMLKLWMGECDVIPLAKNTMQNSSAYGWQCSVCHTYWVYSITSVPDHLNKLTTSRLGPLLSSPKVFPIDLMLKD